MKLSHKTFIKEVARKNPYEPEFLQAVDEVSEYVIPYINKYHPEWIKSKILERICEAERIITFRVAWVDDKGEVQINRGYRVQMNSAIGPYKGGLRFSPHVNLSVLKFLAFEQVFKNSLTGLPIGGGKGGSDFDPKGKSDAEIMRFCQSFMTELFRHIGAETDVPAGDIGVGGREIGFLFGQYKRLRNHFTGVLTGKGLHWGGSYIRPEATGYGLLYFVRDIFDFHNEPLAGKVATISGVGNVAIYAAKKALEFGIKVITLSNSSGVLHDPDGLDDEKIQYIETLGRDLHLYPKIYKAAKHYADKKPWDFPCEIALPCATQNEISEADAEKLVKNGCICVAEGANMPSTNEAIRVFHEANIWFAPGKAANAGGVAVSGLEMTQNAVLTQWNRDKVDVQLQYIMKDIHDNCVKYGKAGKGGYVNYLKGANIAGFLRVAEAMSAQGVF